MAEKDGTFKATMSVDLATLDGVAKFTEKTEIGDLVGTTKSSTQLTLKYDDQDTCTGKPVVVNFCASEVNRLRLLVIRPLTVRFEVWEAEDPAKKDVKSWVPKPWQDLENSGVSHDALSEKLHFTVSQASAGGASNQGGGGQQQQGAGGYSQQGAGQYGGAQHQQGGGHQQSPKPKESAQLSLGRSQNYYDGLLDLLLPKDSDSQLNIELQSLVLKDGDTPVKRLIGLTVQFIYAYAKQKE
jgi:hypothetical protein